MKKSILFLTILLVASLPAVAHIDYYPSIDPVATYITPEGEEAELESGGSYDAPLHVTFHANPTDTAGYVVYYEWTILKIDGGEEITLAVRNDEMMEYTFREGGNDVSYRVGLAITYKERATGTEGIVEQEEGDMLKFSLRGSSMTVYNAFSPNDDGINDIYRVKAQSLLEFRMSIFNRWGQCVATGTDQTLETEYQDNYTYYICWDGTFNGRKVEDGVYFIVIEALGSDGIEYKQRRDINVLTRIVEREKN
jgi:gliding motility-associated-like protein